MKKLIIYVSLCIVVVLIGHFVYFHKLYVKQIDFASSTLDQQVQVVGVSVDNTNYTFISDLNRISFLDDLTKFFINEQNQRNAIENVKVFFSKYQSFISGIKVYDNARNEFTLKRDDLTGEWLEQQYILHNQGRIAKMEELVFENKKYDYYLPIIKDNEAIGNIVVTIDYQKYLADICSPFHLQGFQWQWALDEEGNEVYSNAPSKVTYTQVDKIKEALFEGSVGNIIHEAVIDGEKQRLVSSYYSIQLVQKEFVMVFSSPLSLIQEYTIKSSVLLILVTIIMLLCIIYLFVKKVKGGETEVKRLSQSEKMVLRMIDEMPVGIVIHDNDRKIVKANLVAAKLLSQGSVKRMVGEMFPDFSFEEVPEYFSKNLSSIISPEQLLVVKHDDGERFLLRNSLPVTFQGVSGIMEILIDFTMLEMARRREVESNNAKTEFLQRMNIELRSPLNGIMGAADLLRTYELEGAKGEIVNMIYSSSEHFLSIFNDILDFTKMGDGVILIDERPFNIRDEISYCIESAQELVNETVSLDCNIADDLPAVIISDQLRFRQILTTLITNLIKNVGERRLELKCSLRNKEEGLITIAFELIDTCLLLDPDTIKQVTNDYSFFDKSNANSAEQSIFGNILAKQLIEKLGGELILSAMDGSKGFKIEFTIVAYSNDKISKNVDVKNISSLNGIKTLVITSINNRDEELVASLHKLRLNVSVTSFQKSTIQQIMAFCKNKEEKYSLIIIVDDQFINGFEVAEAIWSNKLSREFYMLMISSNDRPKNYLKCINLDVDYYMTKPVEGSDILKNILDCFPYIKGDNSQVIRPMPETVKVLIVEDNRISQKIMGAILTKLGYSYDFADDGLTGYNLSIENRYDIIFMDLLMTGIDGYETSRRILANDKSAIIIAITADNLGDTQKKAEMVGIREVMYKPVKIVDVETILNKYLNKSVGSLHV